ncbi:TPA: hypothetical protein H1012_03130 [archaeon]|nr:hypothetical protein [Candidatus Naiadarchaeales archaeon SRR2090159.bin1288]
MENPWKDFKKIPSYVLEMDKGKVDSDHYNLDILPIPFIGNPKAKIIFLLLNPGKNGNEGEFEQNNRDYVTAIRKNLEHDESLEYPFYYLDPKLAETSGYDYYHKRVFKDLLEICDSKYGKTNGARELSKKICVIEFVPYHSKTKGKEIRDLPSREYNRQLVDDAIERGTLIIIGRHEKEWLEEVKSLGRYKEKGRVFTIKNKRARPKISKNNLSEEGFAEVEKILGT